MPHRKGSQDRVSEVPLTFHQVKVLPPTKGSDFQGFIDFQGLEIDVEFKAGSTRKGVSPTGEAWEAPMFAHYGEIRNTRGVDGDNLDVYVGDNHDASLVVVIHQHKPGEGYDEDKVILGCSSVEEAIGLYKRHYPKPGFYVGEHKAMPIGAFWRWVHDKKNLGQRIARRQEGALRDNKLVRRIATRYLKQAAEAKEGSALEFLMPMYKALRALEGGRRI